MLLTGNADGTPAASRKIPTQTGRGHVQDIVKGRMPSLFHSRNRVDLLIGIIEGETRVIISGMTMEEIFKERQVFKTKIIENVQSELDQFGLKM